MPPGPCANWVGLRQLFNGVLFRAWVVGALPNFVQLPVTGLPQSSQLGLQTAARGGYIEAQHRVNCGSRFRANAKKRFHLAEFRFRCEFDGNCLHATVKSKIEQFLSVPPSPYGLSPRAGNKVAFANYTRRISRTESL